VERSPTRGKSEYTVDLKVTDTTSQPQKARESLSGKKLLVPRHDLSKLEGYLELELRLREQGIDLFSSAPDWFRNALTMHAGPTMGRGSKKRQVEETQKQGNEIKK